MKINISAKTDAGLERANNEDAFAFCTDLGNRDWNCSSNKYISNGKYGALAIIADGMGGANAGETASTIAIESIKARFCDENLSKATKSESDAIGLLTSAIDYANNAIIHHTETDSDTIGMGTTIVLLWVRNESAYIAWCGDSRCYLFNPRQGLKALTKDHSLVQELIDNGRLSEKDARNHPQSNVITRCLGDAGVSPTPETIAIKVNPDDTFMLCTDGLCGYCSNRQLEKTLFSTISDLDNCCNALVDLALDAGGFDNITVMLLSAIENCNTHISIPFLQRLRNHLR